MVTESVFKNALQFRFGFILDKLMNFHAGAGLQPAPERLARYQALLGSVWWRSSASGVVPFC